MTTLNKLSKLLNDLENNKQLNIEDVKITLQLAIEDLQWYFNRKLLSEVEYGSIVQDEYSAIFARLNSGLGYDVAYSGWSWASLVHGRSNSDISVLAGPGIPDEEIQEVLKMGDGPTLAWCKRWKENHAI